MIDVKELLRTRSVDELNQAAEEYFSQVEDPTYLLSKPLIVADECSKLLQEFAVLLTGLDLCPTMDVLDFGAGSCWSSYFMTQMGCKVYPLDVSRTALEIGKSRYQQHPPFGNRPAPEFLVFDGHRFPLPDGSVDRIVCMHALHHVPNPQEIIQEMARVLREDGIAAFCEPGPEHSKDAISQIEMETGVLENDIVIEELWKWARDAGFGRVELAAFAPRPTLLPLVEYQKFLSGPGALDAKVLRPVRDHAIASRTFFFHKQESPLLTSRRVGGLRAELGVELLGQEKSLRVRARVRNTGEAVWLASGGSAGAVNLGCKVLNLETGEFQNDYWRGNLKANGEMVRPWDVIVETFEVPLPGTGRYEMQFDLVSEHVCWFSGLGRSELRRIPVQVDR